MPAKSPPPAGLKKLKTIIGYKGARFAKLVGVPYNTLKSIESGRLKMSEEVLSKIVLATGVDRNSLFKKTPIGWHITGAPFSRPPKGKPWYEYTEEHFVAWRSQLLGLDMDKIYIRAYAEHLAKTIEFFTRILLLAAVENGKSVSYWSIYQEIASVIKRLGEQKSLMPTIKRMLNKYPYQDRSPKNHLEDGTEVEYTKQDWLNAPQHLRDYYGVTEKELRRVPDYEPYPKSVTVYPEWAPGSGVDEGVFEHKK